MKRFFWVAATLLTLAFLGLLFSLRSYRVFTHEELVGIVRIDSMPKGSPFSYDLWYTPVVRGVPASPRRLLMRGDQWMVGGEILKWHPWLNWLGFKSGHKLTRLSGRYVKAEAEVKQSRTVYDLDGGTDPFWIWLQRYGSWLPFVEAVYGNAAYTLATPGNQWGIYVTLSGYLVKPLRSED